MQVYHPRNTIAQQALTLFTVACQGISTCVRYAHASTVTAFLAASHGIQHDKC